MAMKSLRIVKIDPADYVHVLKKTATDVQFHHVYASVKYHLEERLNDVQLTVYRIENNQPRDDQFFGLLHLQLGDSLKLLINTNSREPDFVRSATRLFHSTIHPILVNYTSYYNYLIRDDIHNYTNEYFREHPSHPFTPMDEPNVQFYATDDQCADLIKQNIELADGYKFIDLTEEAAVQICQDQLYTTAADEKYIALQIRNLGAVGAVHEETGALACYEYLDGLGTISLLYCQPEHRSKGLATAVEKKISQTHLKKHGIRPFKGVSINRPRVIAMSQLSSLWTEVKAPDVLSTDKDTYEIYYCTARSKIDKPKVVIYEN
ncbi:hypothetical protein M3Y98_01180400 [Aphelenchoides besseyi]|nr:hypothetical protein M3Y98_01180400 [Aphelenchoides besseyi]KAI6211066.1 hypothetical protein M3Y96_00393800 [Aphelenchoides besseyi]